MMKVRSGLPEIVVVAGCLGASWLFGRELGEGVVVSGLLIATASVVAITMNLIRQPVTGQEHWLNCITQPVTTLIKNL